MNTLIIPKVKDSKYLDYIRTCPCAFCGFPGPSEPHHIRGVDGAPGTSRVPSDHLALPSCRECHDGEQRYLTQRSVEELDRMIIFHLSEYIIKRTKVGGNSYAERIMRHG